MNPLLPHSTRTLRQRKNKYIKTTIGQLENKLPTKKITKQNKNKYENKKTDIKR